MLRPHLQPQYQPLCRANKYDFEFLLSKDLPSAMKAASDTSRLCNDLVAKQTGNPSKEPGRHYQGTNLRKAHSQQPQPTPTAGFSANAAQAAPKGATKQLKIP